MSWNYRIVQHQDGEFGLHEVYYRDDGTPHSMTERPITFGADAEEGPAGIIASLERALRDARERPVLIEADTFSTCSDLE